MEARCYRGGNGRTKLLNETRFEKRDVVAALMLIIFLGKSLLPAGF